MELFLRDEAVPIGIKHGKPTIRIALVSFPSLFRQANSKRYTTRIDLGIIDEANHVGV